MYEIKGYYDSSFRGLAESTETNFEDMARSYIWEYANKGYFIEVKTPDGVERHTPDEVLALYNDGELDIEL